MARIGGGYRIKDGKIIPVQRKAVSVSERIRQRASKKAKPVRRGAITHGKPTGNSGQS